VAARTSDLQTKKEIEGSSSIVWIRPTVD